MYPVTITAPKLKIRVVWNPSLCTQYPMELLGTTAQAEDGLPAAEMAQRAALSPGMVRRTGLLGVCAHELDQY